MSGVRITGNTVASAVGKGPLVDITGCLACDKPWRAPYLANVPSGGPYLQVRLSGNSFTAWGSKRLRSMRPGPRADVALHENRWVSARPG